MIKKIFKWSVPSLVLAEILAGQLSLFFPRSKKIDKNKILEPLEIAKKRVKKCFENINLKYFQDSKFCFFDHTHGDHYAIFLYFFGNTVFKLNGPKDLMVASFSLNKMLHGLDLFPNVCLPETFYVVHPLATVLGNAKYGNYFVSYQGVTVGSNKNGLYPEFCGSAILFSGSTVIGKCKIGTNVIFGARSFLLDTDVPNSTLVVGAFPNHRFLPNEKCIREKYFDLQE